MLEKLVTIVHTKNINHLLPTLDLKIKYYPSVYHNASSSCCLCTYYTDSNLYWTVCKVHRSLLVAQLKIQHTKLIKFLCKKTSNSSEFLELDISRCVSHLDLFNLDILS